MPSEIHLDVDTDVRRIGQVAALPPVTAGHGGGGHAPRPSSDTVKLSQGAQILQLAENGSTQAAIARALGLTEETVASVLAQGRAGQAVPVAYALASSQPPLAAAALHPRALLGAEFSVDTLRSSFAAPQPTVVPNGEAPPLAGPPGMQPPRRRHRGGRRGGKSADDESPLWRWPLAVAEEPFEPEPANPWLQMQEDDELEAAAHEWTDADGVPVPGGRLAHPEAAIGTLPLEETPTNRLQLP
jgi:DNA-binding CsgD family transcriptional regulator